MTQELKPGCCHKCGLPLSENPHPEAGKPGHYLEVGCPTECIPCTVLSRHTWAERAQKAESELRELRKQLAAAAPGAVPFPHVGCGDRQSCAEAGFCMDGDKLCGSRAFIRLPD